MRSVVDWIRTESDPKKTWLILGKGPSFSLRTEYSLHNYNTMALNDVASLHLSTLNHFTDLDAFVRCGVMLANQGGRTVMPWFPHIDNKPGKSSLAVIERLIPSVGELVKKSLLLSYNSTLAGKKNNDLPTIKVRFFSAVAALNILAEAGVKKIFSLGIDGGSAYAEDFDRKTLLSNGRQSFSDQFIEMAKTIKRHKIIYQPLHHSK